MADTEENARELTTALRRGDRVVAIHYACENFHNVKDRPTAVSSIAVSEASNSGSIRDEHVFSLANAAVAGESPDTSDLEKELLTRFYAHIEKMPDAKFVHWNMNKSTYGFAAIQERYRYLFGTYPSFTFSEDRLYDLDDIIASRFGETYVEHPKLRILCNVNNFHMPFFKKGTDEVEALEAGNYGLIERSCAEKANIIAKLLMLYASGRLKTRHSVGSVEFAESYIDAVKCVLAVGDRFRYIERELRHRHGNRSTLTVEDEYDAQDVLRSVLRLFFADIRPEDYTPSYAGANSRVDFVLPDFGLAVELKYARDTMTDKSLGSELLVDRERYSSNAGIEHLVCLVFDHEGILRNPRGLEKDLSRESSGENLSVTVRIFDR